MTVIICSQKKNGKMSYYRSWDEGFLGPLSLSIRVSPVSAKAFRIRTFQKLGYSYCSGSMDSFVRCEFLNVCLVR